ncbi:MAG: OmpA family protein [Caulobacteraceae bacterium]|nr:OmpA family protein [Caulobacteraceae bacterium]
MRYTKTTAIAAAALAAMALSACATKDFVMKSIEPVDAANKATAQAAQANADQISKTQADLASTQGTVNSQGQQLGAVNGQVNALGGQLASVSGTAKDALDRATAAGKLAEGKFVYSVVLSDDGVKFPVSSTQLSPEAKARLDDLAGKLKSDNKNVYLEIQGYTDATGAPAANQRVAQDRAEAVRRYLSTQGVPLSRMNTISYGEDNPVADNKTKAGRAQNRRVVVVVLS